MTFRQGFTWGAATAAYQIEGAWDAEGKGLSVWDRMTEWPEKIFHGHTGRIACDHYHHLEEDVELMADLGLQAYRFSVSWPRLLPDGTGRVNASGIAFYDRLVDLLLANDIQPWLTLFHWDFPLALYKKGGWLNRDSSEWFSEYAALVAKHLGDRVDHWITLNEPQMFVNLGHRTGIHAPGLELPLEDIALVNHHVLLAHGRATRQIRETTGRTVQIGWSDAPSIKSVDPALARDEEVVEAARRHMFDMGPGGAFHTTAATWSEVVFKGNYPEVFLKQYGHVLPASLEEDLKEIHQPLDFCGMNIYAAWEYHTRGEDGRLKVVGHADFPPGTPRTLFGWPVTPEALYWGPRFFHERYGIPLYITENGMSAHDWVDLDGKIRDHQRIDLTRRYLLALRRAVEEGVDVRGYFHWSLMDNFEWAEGYNQRFGLIHVDFESLRRTPKESAFWYRSVIESNGRYL